MFLLLRFLRIFTFFWKCKIRDFLRFFCLASHVFSNYALRGCCPRKFLHALEIDQVLLVHTPRGRGSPPKKNKSWKCKIWNKIQRVRLNNVQASGSILMKLYLSTCHEAGVINWVRLLEGPPQKMWEGKKSSKIRRDFGQFSTLIANISGTDPHIENRKCSLSTTTPPTLGQKSWTLVHKRKSYWA